jgi:hypothetical protein
MGGTSVKVFSSGTSLSSPTTRIAVGRRTVTQLPTFDVIRYSTLIGHSIHGVSRARAIVDERWNTVSATAGFLNNGAGSALNTRSVVVSLTI